MEELAVGESTIVKEAGDLTVKTTRTEETLFTTTYEDSETGEVRLALRVDITTGATALDPRHLDTSYWTLVAGGEERPMSELKDVFRGMADPSVEVEPEDGKILVYSEDDE